MNIKLKPVAPWVTDEIGTILSSCQSGVLKHEQGTWHCGTSHCIAGWKQTLDIADKLKGTDYEKVFIHENPDGSVDYGLCDYEDDPKRGAVPRGLLSSLYSDLDQLMIDGKAYVSEYAYRTYGEKISQQEEKLRKLGYIPDELEEEKEVPLHAVPAYEMDAGHYAAIKWGLTRLEAGLIFGGEASYELQHAVLERLEQGYRFIDEGSQMAGFTADKLVPSSELWDILQDTMPEDYEYDDDCEDYDHREETMVMHGLGVDSLHYDDSDFEQRTTCLARETLLDTNLRTG